MALEITSANFESEVMKSDKLVMLDFFLVWCGPCRAVGPIVEELSQEFAGKATIAKLNVDNEGDISAQFGVRNIPTILFIKNGEVVDKHVGSAPKSHFTAILNKHL